MQSMQVASQMGPDRVWGMRQGARDYVVKPVNPEELLSKIKAFG